jgi:DNA repair exonuclease SbcCD ATPase subunit
MDNQWYLRTQDETFGPESKARLLEWARMGRIQPGQEISSDGETWTPATEVPFLDMRWSIDIGDGRPRGPFNKTAAQALLSSGRLPPGSRIVEVRPPFETADARQRVPPARESETGTSETIAPPAPSAPPDESPALRREIERLKEALKEAESRVRAARREAKDAAEAARSAESRMSAVMARSATIESEKAKALKDLDELAAAKAARETEMAAERAEAQQALAASKANETKYEDRIQELSDELKRLPATARLAADAQAAVYTLMKDEADDIAAGIEAETRELDELRTIHQARRERLIARRQEILKRIGTDAEDMTRRALLAHPEDPRTAHMRQELEALRLLQ